MKDGLIVGGGGVGAGAGTRALSTLLATSALVNGSTEHLFDLNHDHLHETSYQFSSCIVKTPVWSKNMSKRPILVKCQACSSE